MLYNDGDEEDLLLKNEVLKFRKGTKVIRWFIFLLLNFYFLFFLIFFFGSWRRQQLTMIGEKGASTPESASETYVLI